MSNNKYPDFKKGDIIDKEMLDLLRDNPRELITLSYSSYKDGIIEGFELKVEKNKIKVSKGLIKYEGIILKSYDGFEVEVPKEMGEYTLILKVERVESIKKYTEYKLSIQLLGGTLSINDFFVLATFKLQDGTYLRSFETSFFDFDTEYNFVNIINQRFACIVEEGKLSPLITKSFAREILSKKNLDTVDIKFSFDCINNITTREACLFYIALKTGEEYRTMNNQDIYISLKEILKSFSINRKVNSRSIKRVNKMILD